MQRQKRDRWLNVRVSDAELELLKRLARESRISFSGYIRACLLDDPKAKKRDSAVAESIHELRLLRTELLREGNNYNQIAYELNRRKDRITAHEYAGIAERLESVDARRRGVLAGIDDLLAGIS